MGRVAALAEMGWDSMSGITLVLLTTAFPSEQVAVAEAESGLAQGRKSELKTRDLRRQGEAFTVALCQTAGLCLAQVHALNISALLRNQRSLCTRLMTKGTLVSCRGHRGP